MKPITAPLGFPVLMPETKPFTAPVKRVFPFGTGDGIFEEAADASAEHLAV
jgi:hypothetical protein